MRPINIIVLVITVIESLRAFDLVWVDQQGPQRAGADLGAGHRSNIVGEASRIGFGSALATIMLVISSVFVVIYLRIVMREEPMSAATATVADQAAARAVRAPGRTPAAVVLHAFLLVMALGWLLPLLWARVQLVPQLRLHRRRNGYFSFGGFTLRQLRAGLGAGRVRRAVPQLALHHRAGRAADPVPVVVRGVRRWPGSASSST